ncbi:MAG TPA: tol-pal system-associated acyl-CoA thioesterase [Burkholderiales bacterium]|nr:tol-pal system-associated acyl-CoA thioesterase [Burkholderiales bacterium]
MPLRVYYQDTDAGGVVYHAQYLSFMERARTELLNRAGVDLARLAEQRGVQFMVASLEVKYHRAARLNELISVSAEVVKIGRASVAFRQLVERQNELLVEAQVTLAVVDRGRMKPARMPQELEQALN